MTPSHRHRKIAAPLAAALMLAGCAGPSVTYIRADSIPKSGDSATVGKDEVAKRISDGGTLVALAKTRLMFDLAPDKPAAAPAAKDAKDKTAEEDRKSKLPEEVITTIDYGSRRWQVLAVQAPADGPYLVKPHKSWFEESKLTITKYPQTNLPAVVKFNYVDKTPQRIEQIGKVLLTVVSILPVGILGAPPEAKPAPDDPLKPFVIDIDRAVSGAALPGNSELWTYRVEFDDALLTTQEDVFSRGKFEALTAKEEKVGFYPVPACREAVVTLTRGTTDQLAIRAKVGTPEYVKLVPLQMETVISMKDLCDATVDSKDYEATDAYLARAKAVMDAAESLKKKIDEAKKKK